MAAAGFAEGAAEHERRSAEAMKLPRLSIQNMLRQSDNHKRYKPLGAIGDILSDIHDDQAAVTGAILEVPVYVGDRLGILPRMANKRLEMERQHRRRIAQDLILEIVESYMDVLVAAKQSQLAREKIRVVEGQLRALGGSRTRDPLGSRQILSLQLKLSQLRRTELDGTRKEQNGRAALVELAGYPPDTVLDLNPEFPMRELEGNASSLIRVAQDENPDIRILELAVELANQEIGLVASDEKLQVNFRADYFNHRPFQRNDTRQDVWTVALLSTWNLWDGGQVDQEKKKFRKKLAKSKADLKTGVRTVNLRIRQAWSNLSGFLALMDGLEANILFARNTLNLVTEKYRVNVLPRSDLMEARANLMRAIVDRDLLSAEALVTRARLFRLTGRLDADVFRTSGLMNRNRVDRL